MLLPILWFFQLLWTFSYCKIDCVECDRRVISDGRICSNCTGDFCYYLKYNHVHPSLANIESSYQGCISAPVEYITGCFSNANGNVFCVCNDTDHCNANENATQIEQLAYTQCSFKEVSDYALVTNCSGTFCVKEYSRFDGESYSCRDGNFELEMYKFGFVTANLFLPINSCYIISTDSRYKPMQACAFEDNRKTARKQKSAGVIKCFVPGELSTREKNSTCLGQFCYSVGSDFGCISQFERKSTALKTGLYHLTPFIAPFHICDNDFCNNETLIDADRYSYPTTYTWNSAFARETYFYVLFFLSHVMWIPRM